ncbi:MAG: hypothetical protein ABS76_34300 [Pelagibacterium sp. SCN 64-44]|nr:MAG: hypothetical protein ABS76_34300 [Pelagibacterium sp. SCN 64-44]
MKKSTLLLFALLIATPALAQDYTAGRISISDTWIKEAPPSAPTLGGYVTFENAGSEDDRLIAIESDAVEKVELHTSVVSDGIARMALMQGGLELPAGETVILGEAGTHAMFINPPSPYRDGDEIGATLVLEKAGRVDVVFTVERRRIDDAMSGHEGMSMDNGSAANGH